MFAAKQLCKELRPDEAMAVQEKRSFSILPPVILFFWYQLQNKDQHRCDAFRSSAGILCSFFHVMP